MQPRSARAGGPRAGSPAGPGGVPGVGGLSTAALAGAVDLSALRRTPPPPPPPPATTAAAAPGDGAVDGAGAPGSVTVVDVTEETFSAEVVERSRTVPVIIDFWADWCGPCKQLSPVLERLAHEGGGSWVLAKIDVDANQRLAAAAGVQGIPAVKAVVDGQIVGEFTGALPEPQVRQWIDALLDAVGSVRGGSPDDDGGAALPEPPAHLLAAEEALQRGDVAAAEAAFQSWLDESPADPVARRGLAHVRLLGRLQGRAEPQILAAAEGAPDDVDAQTAAADLELASGAVEAAFDRLVGLVRRTSGTDRDRVREHMIGLFDVVGPDDPRVPAARRALASALF